MIELRPETHPWIFRRRKPAAYNSPPYSNNSKFFEACSRTNNTVRVIAFATYNNCGSARTSDARTSQAASHSRFRLDTATDDVLTRILGHCTLQTILSIRATCRTFRHFVDTNRRRLPRGTLRALRFCRDGVETRVSKRWRRAFDHCSHLRHLFDHLRFSVDASLEFDRVAPTPDLIDALCADAERAQLSNVTTVHFTLCDFTALQSGHVVRLLSRCDSSSKLRIFVEFCRGGVKRILCDSFFGALSSRIAELSVQWRPDDAGFTAPMPSLRSNNNNNYSTVVKSRSDSKEFSRKQSTLGTMRSNDAKK